MPAVEEIRERIAAGIEKHEHVCFELARWLTDHPEVSGDEEKSCAHIVRFLEDAGYEVEAPYAGLKHSFRAVRKGQRNGLLKIALMCEYDALPDLGHGCGHSVSCGISVLAGFALAEAFADLPVQVDLVGTPDEELGGGKILQTENNGFDGYECALMAHLYGSNAPYFNVLACSDMEVIFHGKSAHASTAPWEGVNALNALQLFYHAVDMMRQHVPEGVQMHGVIKDGGVLPSIVPDKAVCHFYPRAKSLKVLKDVMRRMENCAKGAAIATGATYEAKSLYLTYPEIYCGPAAQRLTGECFDALGQKWAEMPFPAGSTDAGATDTVIPVFHPMVAIGNGSVPIQLHSQELVDLIKSDAAMETLRNGAGLLALMIARMAYEPELLEEIRQQHGEYRGE